MTTPPFVIRRLAKEDRSAFDCGTDSLDRYFRTQVSQDVRRHIATAFIAVERSTGVIAGFYTLAAAQVPLADLDEDWRRKLPRYPALPAVLIGRLAIDRRFRGRGLGSALLADAAIRSIRSEIGAYFLIVDALDEAAARFYRHHGMQDVPDADGRLFIPLAVLARPASRR